MLPTTENLYALTFQPFNVSTRRQAKCQMPAQPARPGRRGDRGGRKPSELKSSPFASRAPWISLFSHVRSRLTRFFLGPTLFLKAAGCRQFKTGRNYARDQKFRMTVRAGFATNACINGSAKIELYAGRRQRKFFRCPQPYERGKAWSDETTGGFAGRTL